VFMSFFAKFLDDQEKSINPVHFIMAAFTLAIIAWGSYVVYRTGSMPALDGAATLLGGTGLANLAHKATDIAAQIKKPQAPAVVPPAMVPPPMAPPQQ
jgi:hypothetical protein